jgi:hypothetical protein
MCTIVSIDFNVDDTKASVTQLISRLRPLLSDDPPQHWCIDASTSRYLGPDAAVLIWSTVKMARLNGLTADVVLPTSPPQLHGFCKYSSLRRLILSETRPDPDHLENETVPIEEFQSATWNRPDAIVKLISRHTELDQDTEDYLRNCVAEAAPNIEELAFGAHSSGSSRTSRTQRLPFNSFYKGIIRQNPEKQTQGWGSRSWLRSFKISREGC